MSIDRMDWHYGGDFPEGLPNENGGTHIGIYLAWIIKNDFVGEEHIKDDSDKVNAVKNEKMTGRDFLIEVCDEKFWEDDLNDEGLKFTQYYYDKYYINDYIDTLCKETEVYGAADTWDNYHKLAPRIDKRYDEWKKA